MTTPGLSKRKGSYLIIWITGMLGHYIAEVVEEVPLVREDPWVIKVEEEGPFSRLKAGDFGIVEDESLEFQDKEKARELVLRYAQKPTPLASGLKSLGIEDGKLHTILDIQP